MTTEATTPTAPVSPYFRLPTPEEKARLYEIARAADEASGITGEETMTVEELRDSMEASMRLMSVTPEDRPAQRELMQMRYGDEYPEGK